MSTIDFWLGSKYGSWQYCQKKKPFKKIFPHLCKTSCVIMLIFSHKWEKCPTERNKRLSLWILFINYETLISADWIIENDLYHPMRRSWIFCQTERVGIVFRSLSSCPNSVNSVTCPKLVKKKRVGSIMICSKSAKWLSILIFSMSANWAVWESIYITSQRS